MITIEGRPFKPGVATAVAAVVDARRGIGGVSPALIAEGLKALNAMLPVQDYPEAVIVCDALAVGLSVSIPGVRTVGIAAELDTDAPGLEPDVPCVLGLSGLLRSVRDGDIVIVDGGKGIVHVDPDPETIVHYQQLEERALTASTVYIGAEHLPARTPGAVTVHAYVSRLADLATALDQGADGVIINLACWESGSYDDLVSIMRSAAGKPIAFEAGDTVEQVLRAAMCYAAPHQVSLLFSASRLDSALEKAKSVLELLIAEALFEDISPPRVRMGVRALETEPASPAIAADIAIALIDARRSAAPSDGSDRFETQLTDWIAQGPAGQTVILLGSRIEAVTAFVRAGVRAVAVDPDLVSATKIAIREMASDSDMPIF
ncbi:MAG: hypothetical protein ACP5R5_12085 [Armatimonadota bacterium]